MHHLGCDPYIHSFVMFYPYHQPDMKKKYAHTQFKSFSQQKCQIWNCLAWPRICPTCPASASKATLHSNLRQVPHNMITCCPVLCNPVSPSPSYHSCNPLRSPVLKKEKALASPPSQRQHDAQPAVISNFQSQPLSLAGCLPDSSLCFISLRTRADKSWKLWRKGIIWQHTYPY